MLVPILLSLFWAVCSTVLVLPWFWKGIIKRKTIVGNKEYRGFTEEELKISVYMQMFFALITFIISMTIYLGMNVRYNLYGATIPVLVVLLCHIKTIDTGWNSKRGRKQLILLAIGVVYLSFSITDMITSNMNVIGLTKEVPVVVSLVENEEKKNVPPSSVISSLFKATEVSGPKYSNGKFIYTIQDSPNGYGIVVIDECNGELARFVPCNYCFVISNSIRNKYPFERIKQLNIVVNDKYEPYGKYAILDKPNFFGAPILKKFLLLNLQTGELKEYTELPEFATD